MSMNKNIEVRLVEQEADRVAAYRARYDVYVKELGWTDGAANPTSRTLTDLLDHSGNLFAAFAGKEVVGTIRTHHSHRHDLGMYVDLYDLGELTRNKRVKLTIATMFIVRRKWRLGRVAWELIVAAFEEAVSSGVEVIFIDCLPEMAAFYEKIGFKVRNSSFVHPEYGPGLTMSANLQDCPIVGRLRRRRVRHQPAAHTGGSRMDALTKSGAAGSSMSPAYYETQSHV